jgi:hypothetical protein
MRLKDANCIIKYLSFLFFNMFYEIYKYFK